jgi:hypothetical protein
MTDAPRANRDPAEIKRKRAMLDRDHIAPLTEFVWRLNRNRGGGELVPWFDPTEAGVYAPILALFEAPGGKATGQSGPKARPGSGFISADNDDPSAENMWHILREAGVDRTSEYTAWNIVPWYLGSDRKIAPPTARDLDEALPALAELLGLLPRLQVVLLLGRHAQAGWKRAVLAPQLHVLKCPHPSPRALNGHPERRREIVDAFICARRLAGLA